MEFNILSGSHLFCSVMKNWKGTFILICKKAYLKIRSIKGIKVYVSHSIKTIPKNVTTCFDKDSGIIYKMDFLFSHCVQATCSYFHLSSFTPLCFITHCDVSERKTLHWLADENLMCHLNTHFQFLKWLN